MSDPIPPGGLEVTRVGLGVLLRAQLRLWVASAGAALIASAVRHNVPIIPGLWNDTTIEAVTGALMLAGSAFATWARERLVNSRWWHVATDPRVPDELVRPAPPKKGS